MILRTRHIEKLKELAEETGARYIAVSGEKAVKVEDFISSLSSSGVFHGTSYQEIEAKDIAILDRVDPDAQYIIIRGNIGSDFEYFRTFIEPKLSENTVIFASHSPIEADDIENFTLPEMGFREYAEYRGHTIEVSSIMSDGADISMLNALRDEYILTGGYPENIEDDSSIFRDFSDKGTIIKQELFEKEYKDFDEYVRTLAMNTGNLFKADGIANLIGISRRKVHKYTEILMRHGIIRAIGPWGDHTSTETTRHVKLYFTHLSYLRAILGDMHYQGQMKQGALENFIFLELERKLGESHDFGFYRKKSGAEITFIMTDRENTLVTPIEVNVRATDAISQAMKTFDSDYHDRVERYMLWNDSKAGKKVLEDKTVMVLPHIAI